MDAIEWLHAIADDPEESNAERRRALAELARQRTLLMRLLEAIRPIVGRQRMPDPNSRLAQLRRIHGLASMRREIEDESVL
ncbi:hypothetical protein ACI798_03885 [Geodermatophilus sp. SYSU D01045]